MDGWVKLYRKSVDSRVFARPELWKLWCLCLILANHTDKWVEEDRVLSPVLVKRGQFITGQFALDRAYYPKKTKSDKSSRTVWRWLHELEKWENLTIKTSKQFSVVTICNYSTYQDVPSDDVKQDVEQVSNRCRTGVEQVSTNKNDKNVKNDKKKKPPLNPPKGKVAFDPLKVDLPFDSPEFTKAWADFCAHRQNIKIKLTELAVTRILKKLQQWGEAKAIASIDASIESGKWPGVYEPKGVGSSAVPSIRRSPGRIQ